MTAAYWSSIEFVLELLGFVFEVSLGIAFSLDSFLLREAISLVCLLCFVVVCRSLSINAPDIPQPPSPVLSGWITPALLSAASSFCISSRTLMLS